MINKKNWELVLKTDCSQMSETWISWELDYIIYFKILKLGQFSLPLIFKKIKNRPNSYIET